MAYQAQINIKTTGLAGLNKINASVDRINKSIIAINKGGSKIKAGKDVVKVSEQDLKVKQKILKVETDIANQLQRQRNLRSKTGGGGRSTGTGGTTTGGGGKGIASSALISGAFPLLFGQGIPGAVVGGLGGGIGAAFGGQMGGFAGGLIATGVAQQISTTVVAVGELGQALNPLTADLNRLTQAAGLAGTAEAARIRLLEQVEGKQAALAAATQNMALVIGDEGVRTVKEFGENFAAIRSNAAEFGLKLQSRFAKIFNAIVDKFPSLFGDKGTAEENKALTEAVGEDPVSIALNAELLRIKADLDKLKNDQAIRDASPGLPKAPGFLRGGSTLFPSQMPDLNTEVDKAVTSAKLDENVRVAEQELNTITQSLQKRKELLKVKTDDNIAQQKAKDITDLVLKSTQKNVDLLVAKRDGNLQEVETQQKVADIVQRIVDLGISKDLIDEEEIKKLVEKEQKLESLLSKTKDLGSNFERIGKSIASGVSDNLTAAIQGTKTLGEAAKSILNDLSSSLIRLGVNTLLSKIPGFGGLPILGTRSKGGPVRTGGSFVVGEKGPELFVPKRSGTIIPNDKLAGGGSTNISVNIDASGSSVQGNEQQGKELGRVISAAIQSELIKQRRPGGLLR